MAKAPAYLYQPEFLSATQLATFKKILDIEEDKFIPSHVYHRTLEKNIINKHLRSSEKIEYKDDHIFDWVDNNIIAPINKSSEFTYVLVRDDVEVVKYMPGDFFKKHQDFVNFDSNEFKNYTLLICLQNCEKGGETTLHVEPPITIDGTGRSPGALLLFRKELVHEGNVIEKGVKMIFKCNVLSFYNIKQYEDLIIVHLIKSPHKVFVLPICILKAFPMTPYYEFYTVQKKAYPDQAIFHYEEKILNDIQFNHFYEKIMQLDTFEEEIMNYTNFTFPEVVIRYNKFVHQPKDLFVCTTKDYYQLLPAMTTDNILPFQLVTFESQYNSIIIWCGFYDNIFGTCDYYIEPKFAKNIHQYFIKNYGTMYHRNKEGYLRENPDGKIELQLILTRQESFIPERSHHMDYAKDESLYASVREYLWQNVKRKPLKKLVYDSYKNPLKQMTRFVLSISNKKFFSGGDENGDITENYEDYDEGKRKKKSYTVLEEDTDTEYPKININQDLLNKIDINKVIERLLKIDMTSYMSKSLISEHTCNETNYTTFDIVYRFGCLKIDQRYYKWVIAVVDLLDTFMKMNKSLLRMIAEYSDEMTVEPEKEILETEVELSDHGEEDM